MYETTYNCLDLSSVGELRYTSKVFPFSDSSHSFHVQLGSFSQCR